MMSENAKRQNNRELQLDSLFVRYREACGNPDPDRNFMPGLWQKIESRQSKTMFFERIARTFVAGTMATCGLLGVLMMLPGEQPSALTNSSFVEDVANANARETAPYLDPVHFDFNQDSNGPESVQ